jgi:hypothetical protein
VDGGWRQALCDGDLGHDVVQLALLEITGPRVAGADGQEIGAGAGVAEHAPHGQPACGQGHRARRAAA